MLNKIIVILVFLIPILIPHKNVTNESNIFQKDNIKETSESTKSEEEPTTIENTKNLLPKVIYTKPDYTELIDKLRRERECWRLIEPKKKPKCEEDVCNDGDLESRIQCLNNKSICGSGLYISEKQKADAIDAISIAIDKLNQGTFVDIYDTSKVKLCPNNPQPLRRED